MKKEIYILFLIFTTAFQSSKIESRYEITGPWGQGLDIEDLHAEILVLTKNLNLQKEIIKVEDNRWARRKIFEGQVTRFPSLARDIWAIGDIIYVEKQ